MLQLASPVVGGPADLRGRTVSHLPETHTTKALDCLKLFELLYQGLEQADSWKIVLSRDISDSQSPARDSQVA